MKFIPIIFLGLVSPLMSASWDDIEVQVILDSSYLDQSNTDQSDIHRGLLTVSYLPNFEWRGGDLQPFFSYSVKRGDDGSEISGNWQGISSIDAPSFSAWQEVGLSWGNDDTLIRIGQLDGNSDFAYMDRATDFINPSFGLTPIAGPAPSYPDLAMGVYVQHQFSPMFLTSFGVYNNESFLEGEDSRVYIAENCWGCDETQRLVSGLWRAEHEASPSNNGWYLYYERQLNPNWEVFVLTSQNDGKVMDTAKKHIELGFVNHAPFKQQNHFWGAGFSQVSDPETESVSEIFYAIRLSPKLKIQPDLQWVNNRSSGVADFWVLTLRLDYWWQ